MIVAGFEMAQRAVLDGRRVDARQESLQDGRGIVPLRCMQRRDLSNRGGEGDGSNQMPERASILAEASALIETPFTISYS